MPVTQGLSPTAKPDWRDKEIKKKHAKLLAVRRHNEELKRLLASNGITIPDLEAPPPSPLSLDDA